MTDDETLGVYALKADEYAGLVGNNLANDPLLAEFIAAVQQGGNALDLGCGPGNAALAMANAGLRVTATDAVAEMVALVPAHPNLTTLVASFDDITGDKIYDGIWANFCLLHADRGDMPRHLAALHKAIKPNGIFHIGLKTGTGSKRDKIGRLYTYYTDAELAGLLADAGFTVTNSTTGCDKGMDGVMAEWVALRAYG